MRGRVTWWLAAIALACGLPQLVPHAAPAAEVAPPRHPSRIVALGLPADELALALVEASRIVALDRFADDVASNVLAEARAVPTRVAVTAEAIAALHPDLVLLPAWTSADLDGSLHRFGIATHRVGTPSSVDDVRTSIRDVASVLDAASRGEALVREMDASLARTRARASGPTRTVLLDSGSGLSPGEGTLLAELTTIAGGELLLARTHARGLVPLSLERELSLDPDVLLVDAYRADAHARGVVDAVRTSYGLDPRLSVLRAIRAHDVHPIAPRLLLTTTHHVAATADALWHALHDAGPSS